MTAVGTTVGSMMPPLRALDQDGAVRSLGDLTGDRGLVLLFYRGYW
ncbi:MAG: hypothetical protein ACRD1L_11155 [Terriglobales bacterium]